MLKKGQGAFEYVMIVGIAMVLIVPGAMLFYDYSKRSGDELTRARIGAVGNDILDSVEKIYYIGENSWETIEVDVPDNVNWIYFLKQGNDYELIIEYESESGTSEAVFFSDINVTTPYNITGPDGRERWYINDVPSDPANAHPGLNVIRVYSKGHYVNITEVT